MYPHHHRGHQRDMGQGGDVTTSGSEGEATTPLSPLSASQRQLLDKLREEVSSTQFKSDFFFVHSEKN